MAGVVVVPGGRWRDLEIALLSLGLLSCVYFGIIFLRFSAPLDFLSLLCGEGPVVEVRESLICLFNPGFTTPNLKPSFASPANAGSCPQNIPPRATCRVASLNMTWTSARPPSMGAEA